MVDICQMMTIKACGINQKRLEAVKVLQLSTELRVLYLSNVLISVFFFLQSCDTSVFALPLWCI